MSLILEALRKSEAERRRGELPALALELPPAQARASGHRGPWLAAPLLLLIAAAAVFWATQRPTTSPSPDAPPADPPAAALDPPRPLRTLPVPAPAPTTGLPALPPAPAPVREQAPSPAAATSTTAAVAQPIADIAPIPLADLTAGERRALPPLDLSMHLWSEDPARRFVIVDGRRLGEGDRAGNAVVERIDPEGAILVADGRRIRLPLP